MTPDEICKSFRNARSKTKQIEILSDLNAVSKDEIIKILTEHGEAVPKRKYNKKPKEKPEEPKKEWEDPEVKELPDPCPVPESIRLVLYNRLDELDAKIREYTQGKENAEKEYMEIVDFLKLK